jgi:Mg2+/Co2+ transporter CorB
MLGTMKPFSDLTVPAKLTEVLRWVCVLPVAMLVDAAAPWIVDAAAQVAHSGGLGVFGDSIIIYSLLLILFYVLPKSASIIAGAKTAPRFRRATAIMLAVFAFLFSLLTHVISQHLAGRRIGTTNCAHLSAETVGALAGVAYILFEARKNR